MHSPHNMIHVQMYSPMIETTVLPKVFINQYILPAILLGFLSSTIYTGNKLCALIGLVNSALLLVYSACHSPWLSLINYLHR
jgi:hypothetical protein